MEAVQAGQALPLPAHENDPPPPQVHAAGWAAPSGDALPRVRRAVPRACSLIAVRAYDIKPKTAQRSAGARTLASMRVGVSCMSAKERAMRLYSGSSARSRALMLGSAGPVPPARADEMTGSTLRTQRQQQMWENVRRAR